MSEQHCGLVAIVGAPNAGKSTLVNRLAGTKVSIVTPKAQTTRNRVRAVCMAGQAQLVFIDTPGVFAAKHAFERGMVEEAWAGANDADCVLVLLDAARGLDEDVLRLEVGLRRFKGQKPMVLALNKVDEVRKPFLLSLAAACDALGLFDRIFMISALKGEGVRDMRDYLAAQMPQAPWLYPEDQLTDQPVRAIAAELTREKIFLFLRQELPYSISVETESWEESAGLVRIRQVIRVEREGQKKIMIGAGGVNLKTIGASARQEMERMMGKKVHLELFVKVDAEWKGRA